MLSRVALHRIARFLRKARVSLVEKDDGCAHTAPTLEGGGRVFFHWAQPSTLIEQVPCQSVTTRGTP